MFSVQTHTAQTLEIKKSKFIAHLFPYSEFHQILEQLKLEHPKARHYVTAFRNMNSFNQIEEGSSDDGEPKGTSGKPSLSVLSGHEMMNVGVIIVRYFGGTKLGTGGLVRAYAQSVNLVIAHAALSEFQLLVEFECRCIYSNVGKIEYLLKKNSIGIKDKDFGISEVIFSLTASTEQKKLFLDEAKSYI